MLHMRQSLNYIAYADDSYDDDGPYDPAEHSPMYDVDMEDRTAVFDLAMEDDSDDGGGLLDWSILAGRQRRPVSMSCEHQPRELPCESYIQLSCSPVIRRLR